MKDMLVINDSHFSHDVKIQYPIYQRKCILYCLSKYQNSIEIDGSLIKSTFDTTNLEDKSVIIDHLKGNIKYTPEQVSKYIQVTKLKLNTLKSIYTNRELLNNFCVSTVSEKIVKTVFKTSCPIVNGELGIAAYNNFIVANKIIDIAIKANSLKEFEEQINQLLKK